MKILMNYRDGEDTVQDAVIEDESPSFDVEIHPAHDSVLYVRVGFQGGTTVEITAEEILQLVRAGFNL